MKKLSNFGFSMMEMTIVMGLVGILAMFIAQMVQMSGKTQNRLNQSSSLSLLDTTIRLSLENPELCTDAFRDTNDARTVFNPLQVANFKTPSGAVDHFTSHGRKIFKVGSNETVIAMPVSSAELQLVGPVKNEYSKVKLGEIEYYKHNAMLNLKVTIGGAEVPREYPLYVYTEISGDNVNRIKTCATSNLSAVSQNSSTNGTNFESSIGLSGSVPIPSGRPGPLGGAPAPTLPDGMTTNEPGAVHVNKSGENYRILMGLKGENTKWVCLKNINLANTCGDDNGCQIIWRMLVDNEGYDRVRMYATTLYTEQPWMSENEYYGKYGYTAYYGSISEWISGDDPNISAYNLVDLWSWIYLMNYKHIYCGAPAYKNYPTDTFEILLNPGVMADIEILDDPK